jgi:Cof subfamily protein (haloacid dehalogenase superfamily)
MTPNGFNQINTFIFDLDGTLLNNHHEIADETVSAIAALRERKANLILATGRHIKDAGAYLERLGGDMAAITSNGANVHDRHGNLVYNQRLPLSINQALLPLGQAAKVHNNVFTEDEWLVCGPNQTMLNSHAYSKFFYRHTDHAEMLEAPALKILFHGDHGPLRALREQIQLAAPAPINITFSDENHLEIMQNTISKGHSLKILLEKLALPIESTMAFGDGMNDVELFKAAAAPVVMGNASNALKELFPQAHRAGHNHEQGVAQFLREFIL